MKRRVPRLTSDKKAEAFLESDLSNLDFSQFKSGRLRFDQGSPKIEEPAPSETYRLFEQAMLQRKQIICIYKGEQRAVCPIILGHSRGEERALTYQFAGGSNSRVLPPEGDWKCLTLSNVSEVRLREGPWYGGNSHKQPSRCVEIVDVDVNDESPYQPKRRLADLATGLASRTKNNKTAVPKKPRPRAK